MGLSFGHIVVILLIVLVLFGAGRLPQVMGDLGKGLRSFKDGLKGEDHPSDDDGKKDALPPSDKKGD
ncbi:MAG: twin-arginine translocase TatA/TatE family subunit [Alphaproteobacteria bacterium]|nr:twin-arginine translocase TatA/TatE family subunit [Alphaproteobacteria bacterium]